MIYKLLFDWQQEIVNSIKDKDRWGLFLDMGVGKTPISLALAEVNKADKIIIVVMANKVDEPVTKEGSWLNWSSKMATEYIILTKKKKKMFSEEDVTPDEPQLLFINYDMLHSREVTKKKGKQLRSEIQKFIKSCKKKNVAIILDESHMIKSLSSTRTKMIEKLEKAIKPIASKLNLYLLTGTPFTKDYEDLYSQLKLLGVGITKKEFLERFAVRGERKGLLGWQQPIIGWKNVEELFNLVHSLAYTIKTEDVIQLPDRIYIDHVTQESEHYRMMTTKQLYPVEIYRYAKSRGIELELDLTGKKKINNPYYKNIAYPSFKWFAETTGSFWLRCRQLSIGFQGNAEEAVWFDKTRLDLLKDFLDRKRENFVIFYNYTEEFFEIYKICEELGYLVDVYNGDIKSLHFYDEYEHMTEDQRFNAPKRVIIANYASGSVGKNWQLYSHGVEFSVPVYKDRTQGVKRLHRIGQKNTVYFHRFYQNNWLDISMMESLRTKDQFSSDLFGEMLDIFSES